MTEIRTTLGDELALKAAGLDCRRRFAEARELDSLAAEWRCAVAACARETTASSVATMLDVSHRAYARIAALKAEGVAA